MAGPRTSEIENGNSVSFSSKEGLAKDQGQTSSSESVVAKEGSVQVEENIQQMLVESQEVVASVLKVQGSEPVPEVVTESGIPVTRLVAKVDDSQSEVKQTVQSGGDQGIATETATEMAAENENMDVKIEENVQEPFVSSPVPMVEEPTTDTPAEMTSKPVECEGTDTGLAIESSMGNENVETHQEKAKCEVTDDNSTKVTEQGEKGEDNSSDSKECISMMETDEIGTKEGSMAQEVTPGTLGSHNPGASANDYNNKDSIVELASVSMETDHVTNKEDALSLQVAQGMFGVQACGAIDNNRGGKDTVVDLNQLDAVGDPTGLQSSEKAMTYPSVAMDMEIDNQGETSEPNPASTSSVQPQDNHPLSDISFNTESLNSTDTANMKRGVIPTAPTEKNVDHDGEPPVQ